VCGGNRKNKMANKTKIRILAKMRKIGSCGGVFGACTTRPRRLVQQIHQLLVLGLYKVKTMSLS
jgi:hypothetical protein